MIYDVIFFNNTYFFFMGSTAGRKYYYSTDLVNFTLSSYSFSAGIVDCYVKNGKLIVIANGKVFITVDGQNWTSKDIGTLSFGEILDEGPYLVHIDPYAILYSSDLENWNVITSANGGSFNPVFLAYYDGYYYISVIPSTSYTLNGISLLKTADFVNFSEVGTYGLGNYKTEDNSQNQNYYRMLSRVVKLNGYAITFRRYNDLNPNLAITHNMIDYSECRVEGIDYLDTMFENNGYIYFYTSTGNRFVRLKLKMLMPEISQILPSCANTPYVKYK